MSTLKFVDPLISKVRLVNRFFVDRSGRMRYIAGYSMKYMDKIVIKIYVCCIQLSKKIMEGVINA